MIFTGADGSETESTSAPESTRTAKAAQSTKLQVFHFLCCGRSALISNNVVAPESETTISKRSSRREASVSMSGRSSYNALAYTEKGRGLIARLLYRIERKLNQLLKTYTDEGKIGRALPWQIQMNGYDIDFEDEDDKSAVSKMSWTYRVPNKMKK